MAAGLAAIGFVGTHHALALLAWAAALALLFFHFFVNSRRNLAVDCLVVGLFAFLLSTLCAYGFGGDDTEYLFAAKNLVDGYGPRDETGAIVLHRIGYTLIYAFADWLGGASGAALVPSAGFAFFCAAAYGFGRALHGARVAAAGIILFLLFPRELVNVNIDNVAGGFVLLAFAVWLLPPGRHETRFGLAGAALLGLGFLAKETAVVGLAYPLLLIAVRTDRRLTRRLLVGFAGALAAIVAVGLAEAFVETAPPAYFSLGDEHLASGADMPLRYAWSLLLGMAGYFWSPDNPAALLRFAPILALLPIAVGYSAWRAWRGSRSGKALLAAMLVWAPVIAAAGLRHWRPEQALPFVALALLAVAVLLAAICRRLRQGDRVFAAAIVAVAMSLLVQELFVGDDDYRAAAEVTLDKSAMAALVAFRPPRVAAQLVNGAGLAGFGTTVPPGQKIWSSPVQPGVVAALAANRHFWVAPVPLHALIRLGDSAGYVSFAKGWTSRVTRPLWGVYATGEPNAPLFILYRDDLAEGFRNVKGVLLFSGRDWVRDLPGLLDRRLLMKEADLIPGRFPIALYRWDEAGFGRNIDRRFIDRNALRLLQRLAAEKPDLFAWYRRQLQEGGIDLDAARVAALLATAPADGDPVIDLD